MLYQDPHPAHRGFAEAIGADLVDYRAYAPEFVGDGLVADVVNGLGVPSYETYIVEGSRPLYTAIANRMTSKSRLIYLCADHGLYSLGRGDFRGSSAMKRLIGMFGAPAIKAVARRYIDGVVAVSDFAAAYTRPIVGSETPITVAHPYIQSEVYEALGTVEPALDADVAVTVGRPDRYKGVDLLVDAWPDVRAHHAEATLHVVGRGHPERYGETPGVRVRGYVAELADAFAPASVYVQPSRMDSFPVSVLEGMRAGLPPIVTDTTGTRSEAREIAPWLVAPASSSELASAIIDYFNRPLGERRYLSERARERGDTFDPDSRKTAFKEAFDSLLEDI